LSWHARTGEKQKARLAFKQCLQKRILSSEVPHQICPSFNGNEKAIPDLRRRQHLWDTWYSAAQQAAQVSSTEVKAKRKQTRLDARVAKQAKWDFTVSQTSKEKIGYVPRLPITTTGRTDDTWWRCSFCDYRVKYGDKRRSDLKRKHLKDMHCHDNIPLHDGKNDPLSNPSRLIKASDAYDARWNRLQRLMSEPHKVAKEPSYFREYTNKRGIPWKVALYPCLLCGMKVQIRDFPNTVCKEGGPPPKVAVRKQLWQNCGKKLSNELSHLQRASVLLATALLLDSA
jgi:hypothetical protein